MKKYNKKILFISILIIILINLSIVNVYGVNLDSDTIKVTRGEESIRIKETKEPGGTIGDTWFWNYEIISQVYAYEILSLDFEVFSGYGLDPWDGGTIKQISVTNNEYINVQTKIDAEYEYVNSAKVHMDINLLKASSEAKYVVFEIGDDETTLNLSIKITIRENREVVAAQEDNEMLSSFYQKNISELTNADYKLKYLRSVLYNDQINGNTDLWDKFVSETTPEQRKAWKREITLNWRDSDKKYQSAIDALGTQIAVDDNKASETDLNNVKQEAGEIQQETHRDNNEFVNRIFAQFDIGLPRPDVPFIDVLENIDKYVPITSEDGIEQLTGKVNIILTIITSIGMVVAVLMLAIIGIKYMLGSVEEKAEYKKDMIPYLVGAVLIFGICAITKVLQQFGESINNI